MSESASQPVAPASATAFVLGDKVLAFHGPLMYLAKVMDVDVAGPAPRYFIHYEGWKRKWDEWVAADRLLPDTPANQDKLKQLSNDQAKQSKKKRAKTDDSKEGEEDGEEEEAGGSADEENPFEDSAVKIQLPDELKAVIVQDWENITQRGQMVALPRSPSIAELFKRFMGDAKRKNVQAIAQVVEALDVYFDRALPLILLYRAERAQFEEFGSAFPGKRFCDVYGPEHLLRLFVRLPHLLAHADIGESELLLLQSRLQDLFKFLAKADCFPASVYVARPAAAVAAASPDAATAAASTAAAEPEAAE
jgi:mortality factor 4-like protein 1